LIVWDLKSANREVTDDFVLQILKQFNCEQIYCYRKMLFDVLKKAFHNDNWMLIDLSEFYLILLI
jgi:hypothetical protein